jgi:Ca2+-binding RTX toxin-like protein
METGVETLEARRLMSAAEPFDSWNINAPADSARTLGVAGAKQANSHPFAVLSRGTLTVDGTSGDDVIRFGWVNPGVGLTAFPEVRLNGQAFPFRFEEVLRIIIRAGRGNDDIDAYGNGAFTAPNAVFPYRVTTFAGPGDDRITGSSQSDRIVGGPGDDTIFARDNGIDLILGGRGRDGVERDDDVSIGRGMRGADRVRGVETVTPR